MLGTIEAGELEHHNHMSSDTQVLLLQNLLRKKAVHAKADI